MPPGTLGGMELAWFELSQDSSGRWVASCPAKGVSAIGHTSAVAQARLRYAIEASQGAPFTGELKEGREPKPKAQSASSESETKDLKPSKQKRERD